MPVTAPVPQAPRGGGGAEAVCLWRREGQGIRGCRTSCHRWGPTATQSHLEPHTEKRQQRPTWETKPMPQSSPELEVAASEDTIF